MSGGEIPSAALALKQDILESIEIDDNVADHFPPDSKLVAARPHGASFWTRTARVSLELTDGSTQNFFLKMGKDNLGRALLQSEYEGVKALYRVVPELVPRSIAWGEYKSTPSTYFYIADFVPMTEKLPDPQAFCALLAKLHNDSIQLSPNGKFGFLVQICTGAMPLKVDWCDTWEESYSRGLREFTEQEKKVQGLSEELERLYPTLFDKVIPRLLRPLSTGGRTIKPVLVHGDLWHGNMATNVESGKPISFDPAVSWAHNEYQ